MKKNINKNLNSQKEMFASKKTDTDISYRTDLEKQFFLSNEFKPQLIDYYRLEPYMGKFKEPGVLDDISVFINIYDNFQGELVLIKHLYDGFDETLYSVLHSRIRSFSRKLKYRFSVYAENQRTDTLLKNQQFIYGMADINISDKSVSTIKKIFTERECASLVFLKNFFTEKEIFTLILNGFLLTDLDNEIINSHTMFYLGYPNETVIDYFFDDSSKHIYLLNDTPERPEDLNEIF